MTDDERIAELEQRVKILEDQMERIRPWLSVMYHDMLKLTIASAKAMHGETDEANKLFNEVSANVALVEVTEAAR